MLSSSSYVRPSMSLDFFGSYLIDLYSILAMPFGRFEAAERKSDHMSWDMPYLDVSYATRREISLINLCVTQR